MSRPNVMEGETDRDANLEKSFGGFTRSYPDDGSDPLAYPSSGFLWDNALARKKTLRNFGDAIKASCPLGRIGAPEDMAGVAIYLASRAGSYVTGTVIPVDGGITVRPS